MRPEAIFTPAERFFVNRTSSLTCRHRLSGHLMTAHHAYPPPRARKNDILDRVGFPRVRHTRGYRHLTASTSQSDGARRWKCGSTPSRPTRPLYPVCALSRPAGVPTPAQNPINPLSCRSITAAASALLPCTDCTLAQPLPLPTANSPTCLTSYYYLHDCGSTISLLAAGDWQ
jgi:hypothetical protein